LQNYYIKTSVKFYQK